MTTGHDETQPATKKKREIIVKTRGRKLKDRKRHKDECKHDADGHHIGLAPLRIGHFLAGLLSR